MASIVLCRKVAIHLHTLAENNVISCSSVLPEAFAGSATASSLLINNQSGFRFTGNAHELSHEVGTGNVTTLIVCGLNHDGGHRTRVIMLLSDGRTDSF